MRWEALFGDLEGQLDAERQADLRAEVADRTRAEWSALSLLDRLRGQPGQELTCWLLDGRQVGGRLAETGDDWILLDDTPVDGLGAELLVPVRAVTSIAGLGPPAAPERRAPTGRRLPLTVILRGLARDRARVRVALIGSDQLIGRVGRVGSDHLELTLGSDDPIGGGPDPVRMRTVRTASIATIRIH
jgi:hypothetical protein